MATAVSRRRFLTTGGAGVLGAYMLLDSMAGATARAAMETAVQGAERRGADTVVVSFNAACLEAVRVTHPGPPVVARSLAVLHTCMYDAWAVYDKHAVGTQSARGYVASMSGGERPLPARRSALRPTGP